MMSSNFHQLENSKNFIEHTIKRKGPLDPQTLKDVFSSGLDNCPAILTTIALDKLVDFVTENSNLFVIKRGYICLVQLEEKFKNTLLTDIKKRGSILFSDIQDSLSSVDKSTSLYIQATDCWQQGTINFIFRNDDVFMLKEETICLQKQENLAPLPGDEAAVQYFKNILQDKGNLQILKLVGHLNQAPENVKNVVRSTNPAVFKQFLQRNADNFKISDDIVSCTSIAAVASSSLAVAPERKAIEYFKQRLQQKGGSQKLAQLAGFLSQTPSEITDTLGSKTPLGLESFLRNFPAEISVQQDVISLLRPPVDKSHMIKSTTVPKVVSTNSVNDSLLTPLNDMSDILEDNAADADVLREVLSFLPEVNYTNAEMIWLDVGKKPFLKTRVREENPIRYEVYEIQYPQLVDKCLLLTILDHEKIMKVSKCFYGIAGSMHTLRAMWVGESLYGLTIFPRRAVPIPPDIVHKSVLSGISLMSYHVDQVSQDSLSSCVREFCKASSNNRHVILVDYHGKRTASNTDTVKRKYRRSVKSGAIRLVDVHRSVGGKEAPSIRSQFHKYDGRRMISGADHSYDVGCGNARRLLCLDDPVQALTEAVAHRPDMIVTNCCHDENTFYSLEKIRSSEIEIVAVLTASLNERLAVCQNVNNF